MIQQKTENGVSRAKDKRSRVIALSVLCMFMLTGQVQADTAENPNNIAARQLAEKSSASENSRSDTSEKDVADILRSLKVTFPDAQQSVAPHALPKQLGELTIFGQITLRDIIESIYGPYSCNEKTIAAVHALNPHLIDSDLLQIGDKIKLPTLAVSLPAKVENLWWIRLLAVDNFQEAYQYLKIYEGRTPPLSIIPSWNVNGEFIFSIMLEEGFASQQEAEKKLQLISADVFPDVTVLAGLNHENFYFEEVEPQAAATIAIADNALPEKETSPAAPAEIQAAPLPGIAAVAAIAPAAEAAEAAVRQVGLIEKSKEKKTKSSKKVPQLRTSKTKEPVLLGTMTVAKGDTLGHMIRGAYGKNTVNRRNIKWIAKHNRHIKNPNNIAPGTQLEFPMKPVLLPTDASKGWWLQLGTFDTLQNAYTFLRRHTSDKHWLLIIPSYDEARQAKFHVFVEQYFDQANEAGMKLRELAGKGFNQISMQRGLDEKYYFKERSGK